MNMRVLQHAAKLEATSAVGRGPGASRGFASMGAQEAAGALERTWGSSVRFWRS